MCLAPGISNPPTLTTEPLKSEMYYNLCRAHPSVYASLGRVHLPTLDLYPKSKICGQKLEFSFCDETRLSLLYVYVYLFILIIDFVVVHTIVYYNYL